MAGDPAPKVVAVTAKAAKVPQIVAPGRLVPPSIKTEGGEVIRCMVSVKGIRCKNPARHPIVDPSQPKLTFHICTTHSLAAQIALVSAVEAGLVKSVGSSGPKATAKPRTRKAKVVEVIEPASTAVVPTS
jgi:hypothetical protein